MTIRYAEPRGHAIVPAAGLSLRMGQSKLLLPWRGGALLEHALRAWQASRVASLTLVVHPQAIELARLGRAYGAAVVVPDVPPQDMRSSVLWALSEINRRHKPHPTDAWLMAPADLPQLSTGVIDTLLTRFDSTQAPIWVPCHDGRRGHPVLFAWSLVEQARALPADCGLNELFRRVAVREVEMGPLAVPTDVDTPADYAQLRAADEPVI